MVTRIVTTRAKKKEEKYLFPLLFIYHIQKESRYCRTNNAKILLKMFNLSVMSSELAISLHALSRQIADIPPCIFPSHLCSLALLSVTKQQCYYPLWKSIRLKRVWDPLFHSCSFEERNSVEEFRARRCRPTTPLCTARTGRVIHNIRFESGPNNVNAT